MTQSYQDFLKTKTHTSEAAGFDVTDNNLNSNLFEFQRDIVRWSLRRGRAAIFANTGMGKTIQQLAWADQVHRYTNKKVLLLAPLAVSYQTKREGEKFGIESFICNTQADVKHGINITNYQKLHKFDTSDFDAIVLDESSIIKAYDGKTRTLIIDTFERMPYRLACTATPAPNDFMELGNHAEFLGVMSRAEMLAKYFVHDGGDTSQWRLKGHAEDEFWRWVASWAVMLRKPSDLGYCDNGFILPSLNIHEIVIPSDKPSEGYLFPMEAKGLNEQRQARRESLDDRVGACVKLIDDHTKDEPWIIWCDLNSEADLLEKQIKGAVQIAGRHDDAFKEQAMIDFTEGKFKRLVTKPKIAGHGMNWQHCNNVVFVGISHSWEAYFQAIRRCWRFGQAKEVNCYIIISEREGAVLENIKRKERDAERMGNMMVKYMTEINKANLHNNQWQYDDYNPAVEMRIPEWLRSEI